MNKEAAHDLIDMIDMIGSANTNNPQDLAAATATADVQELAGLTVWDETFWTPTQNRSTDPDAILHRFKSDT